MRSARLCERRAVLLTRIAEVDERKLYLAEGHSSMFTYCVGELRMSEEAAGKRIHAARTARRFPALFVALAEGHLHLTAVQMLAPHLTSGNAADLLAAATHQAKVELELLLVRLPLARSAGTAAGRPTPSHAVPGSIAQGPRRPTCSGACRGNYPGATGSYFGVLAACSSLRCRAGRNLGPGARRVRAPIPTCSGACRVPRRASPDDSARTPAVRAPSHARPGDP